MFEKEGGTIPTSTHYKADLQDREPISDTEHFVEEGKSIPHNV